MPKKQNRKRSPSALSAEYLRKQGYIVCRVEQTIPHTFIKRDAFNLGDLLACHVEFPGALLVQSTGGGGSGKSNFYAHMRKALSIPELETWLMAGNRFVLHGWKWEGPRGAKRNVLIEKGFQDLRRAVY